jgi:hypothetical protein
MHSTQPYTNGKLEYVDRNDRKMYIRRLDLSIPTIGGIVSLLIGQVLTEADAFGLHTGASQENEIANKEITKGLIVYNTLSHCITNGHLPHHLVAELALAGIDWEHELGHGGKFGMTLIPWINKMLDLSKRKFTKGASIKT